MDEYWDYRTGITYPDYEIGKMRYPVEQLHYPYDMKMIVPAPSGTRFADYLRSHSRNAQELLLNVRRYEREVSDGVITYEQYETVFENAVEYCKELAPNIRYIECSNEVDIQAFGLLNAEEYVAIYLCAHRAIKRLNEKHNYEIPLELGGFGQAHPLQSWPLREKIMELLKQSEIGDDPMAFYAYHMYNAPENRSLTNAGINELAVLTTNPTCDSVPSLLEVSGLENGQYVVEAYCCNLLDNNIIYHLGTGDGTLQKTKETVCTVEDSVLRYQELFDKDCFSLNRIRKI